MRHLQGELDAEGSVDWSQFNVDSTVVQAARAAAGGPMGDTKGSEPSESRAQDLPLAMDLSVLRGGFFTKVHLLTDRQGLPLGAVLSAGQRRESAFFTDLMDQVSVPRPRGRPRKRPEAAQGDRAYDATWIRQWCADRGIESAIPARKDPRDGLRCPPTCDDRRYRDRNTVERCVGHLKERRRLVVRYEKKASHYKAMVLWAFVEEYLSR